jgi:hypothetical protein
MVPTFELRQKPYLENELACKVWPIIQCALQINEKLDQRVLLHQVVFLKHTSQYLKNFYIIILYLDL